MDRKHSLIVVLSHKEKELHCIDIGNPDFLKVFLECIKEMLLSTNILEKEFGSSNKVGKNIWKSINLFLLAGNLLLLR